jgi:hypothetical protein
MGPPGRPGSAEKVCRSSMERIVDFALGRRRGYGRAAALRNTPLGYPIRDSLKSFFRTGARGVSA